MYAHIIPQVYLKQWKVVGTKNSIFFFNKANEEWRQKNIKEIAGKNNYYRLRLYTVDDLSIDVEAYARDGYKIKSLVAYFPEFFDDLFSRLLSKYEIYYDETRVDETFSIETLLSDFDFTKTVIKKDGNLIKKRLLRLQIEKEWQEFSDFLEEKLCSLENEWKTNIVDGWINEILQTEESFVYQKYYDLIIEFMAIQEARDLTNPILKSTYTQTFELINQVIKDLADMKIDFNEEDYRASWLIQLLLHFKKGDNNLVDALKKFYHKGTISFLKAEGLNEFITCDLPIIRYQPFWANGQGHAILFPISPKLCLMIAGGSEEVKPPHSPKCYIFKAENEVVAYINQTILNGAKEVVYANKNSFCSTRLYPAKELIIMKKQTGMGLLI